MKSDEGVESVLQGYIAGGMTRLEAIRRALQDEQLERAVDGDLKLRSVKRRPGRQLLPL